MQEQDKECHLGQSSLNSVISSRLNSVMIRKKASTGIADFQSQWSQGLYHLDLSLNCYLFSHSGINVCFNFFQLISFLLYKWTDKNSAIYLIPHNIRMRIIHNYA